MTKLEKLIEELCPNGVEYQTIYEVVGVNRGKRLTKRELSDDAEYEVYHGSKDSILGKYYKYNAPANTTIVVNTGGIGGVKFLDKPFWCSDGSFWLGQAENVDNKYIYYCLSGYEDYFYSQKRVGGVPTIDRDVVGNFKIPVPPIEVQSEIVRILDNFTELTSELNEKLDAELTARKKQYEYYRDELLTLDRNILRIKLEDICKIGDGLHSTPVYDSNGDYYFINGNNLNDGTIVFDEKTKRVNEVEYKKYKIEFNDNTIFMSINGTIGKMAIYNGESIVLGKSAAYFVANDKLLSKKYLYYYLQSSSAIQYYLANLTGSTIKNLGLKALRNMEIPLPPLNEQQRIVDILDRFDTLCNDISQGLPAEIEALQKQYEYYRDKLLTFKEKEV